jgi:hypothetical protein
MVEGAARQALIDGWVAKAPRPDLRRPKNRVWAGVFFDGHHDQLADLESLPEIIEFTASLDNQFEQVMGTPWVDFIVSVPADLQAEVLVDYAMGLMAELGKG